MNVYLIILINGKKMNYRKLLLEIILITVFSVALGLVYNFLSPKGIPLIFKPKVLKSVSDEQLFGVTGNGDQKSKANTLIDTNQLKTKPISDTVITKNEKSEKDKDISISTKDFTISYSQMNKVINNPDFIIIDARNPIDYKKDHIKGAINIFPYDAEEIIFNKIFALPANKKIVVYCEGGDCDASHKLAEMLAGLYDNIWVYSGGWEEWISKRRIISMESR